MVNMCVPFLIGRRVRLKSYTNNDFLPYMHWINNQVVRQYFRNTFPFAHAEERDFLADSTESSQRSERISFMIWIDEGHRMIGDIGLHAISWSDRNAWLGGMIGEPDCLGKGYFSEASELFLDFAFGDLCMHKIMGNIYAPNKRSQRFVLNLGFTFVGTIKDEIFVDGHYQDVFIYQILKGDWIKRRENALACKQG